MKFPKGYDADNYTAFLWKRAVSDLRVAELIIEERESFGSGLYLEFEHPIPSKAEARNYIQRAKKLAASLPNPLAN